jgi:hypothetical protein
MTSILAGCSRCPPTTLQSVTSPNGEYVAVVYSYQCSAVAPFNAYADIALSGNGPTATLVQIVEAPYSVRVDWRAKDELTITIDCPFDTPGACARAKDRAWTIETKSEWRNVKITYQAGPQLQKWLGPDALTLLRQ